MQVRNVEQNERGEYTITIESTLEGTRCRQCGREITDLHGVDEAITLRHLPILGRPVYLRLRPKRYRCPSCEEGPDHNPTALMVQRQESAHESL